MPVLVAKVTGLAHGAEPPPLEPPLELLELEELEEAEQRDPHQIDRNDQQVETIQSQAILSPPRYLVVETRLAASPDAGEPETG